MLTWGDQQHAFRLHDQAAKEAREIARGINKLLIGGNAGGAAVALAMIHSSVGKCGPYPGALFLVLSVFVTGLAAAWFVMARDHRTIQLAGLIAVADKDTVSDFGEAMERYQKEMLIARRFASFALVAGMAAGLLYLASIASWRL